MKKNNFLYIIIFLLISAAHIKTAADDNKLRGRIVEKSSEGTVQPVAGAVIFWNGSNSGTASDESGEFELPFQKGGGYLIVRMAGYITDTIAVQNPAFLEIQLTPGSFETEEVTVTATQQASYIDFLDVQNKLVVTEKELRKAPCCNLSESFETNPSVDVSFPDAITGLRQIEMLGLSGKYTQSTIGNLPYFRGLLSTVGLTYIPGSWIKSINMVKGIGSVVNGFESITGQIDVELHRPVNDGGKKANLYLYTDYDRRAEGNLYYKTNVAENIDVITMAHLSGRRFKSDNNHDFFSDSPDFMLGSFMQRWDGWLNNEWEWQFGYMYVSDNKSGGTISNSANSYRYTADNAQYNINGKLGFVGDEDALNTFGMIWSFNHYTNKSLFGIRDYAGTERTGYLNFIYQMTDENEVHKLRTGISYFFDAFDETYLNTNYKRTEKIPGLFAEYAYLPVSELSVVPGIRVDFSNYYGTVISPRLHIKYLPSEDLVLRLAAGKGFRSASIFSENSALLFSARKLFISPSTSFGYGLDKEEAWNFGFNSTYYFYFYDLPGTFAVDFYRTQFVSAVISDIESDRKEISISSVKNGAYSNSVQAELNFSPFARFDMRLAYRKMDAQQLIGGGWSERPLTSSDRALLNFAYADKPYTPNTFRMVYDLTVQWSGKKRLPSGGYSPSFSVVNGQLTGEFSDGFSVFVGVENIFDYMQHDLIIDYMNPYSDTFDASVIWGPVLGRMIYAGVRLGY
ncbi:MAG: TonB-dependent receptor [Ignavibacteriaceae bacterium]|nr:TonB-dependent receptor [Ignavibacteriaceae bacterium]